MELVVLDKKGIILPRVEKGQFIRLLRLGLDYNREKGVFSIKNFDNIEVLTDTISNILNDKVLFLQNCFKCNTNFPCSDCKYEEFCATRNLPFKCICSKCLNKEDRSQQRLS